MSEIVFDTYSQYYELLYKDKDYEGEAEYVFEIIRTYNSEAKDILELGMGTGIHAKLLQEKGLLVTGIELSASMAQMARQRGLDCLIGSCVDFSIAKKFDFCISLFHVISYVTENEDLVKTFSNVSKHLNVGGLFLFDVWYTPAVYNLKPETRIKRLRNDKVAITRLAEPEMQWNRNVVDVNYEIYINELATTNTYKVNEKHPMRHFSIPEIELLAEHTGFSIIRIEEWLSSEKPSEKTWGVCFVIQKK